MAATLLILAILLMRVEIYGVNRKHFRGKKTSKNRQKARILLAAVHGRVANTGTDFQHKLSREMVDENQAVIVETLKPVNMLKNHNLARAIGDAGWKGFITKLDYKPA